MIIFQGKIQKAKLTTLKKTHSKDCPQWEKHEKTKQQSYKNCNGWYDEFIKFHSCRRDNILIDYVMFFLICIHFRAFFI